MKPLVGIIMGSKSDWETLQPAAEILEQLGIAHEVKVVSAHRTPDLLFEYASQAEGRGLVAIIAGAGGAAMRDERAGERRAHRMIRRGAEPAQPQRLARARFDGRDDRLQRPRRDEGDERVAECGCGVHGPGTPPLARGDGSVRVP
jgi:hypothetical protein